MKKLGNCAVISGTSYEENAYVNLENLQAQKIEKIPNRKETPAAKITQHQVILILVVLLLLMFLILVVLTSLLYSNYKSISEEVSQMKSNDAEDTKIMKSQLNELKNRNAEDTRIMKSKLKEPENQDVEDTKIMKNAEDTKIMKSKLSELENRDAEDTKIMKNAEDTKIMKSKLNELENKGSRMKTGQPSSFVDFPKRTSHSPCRSFPCGSSRTPDSDFQSAIAVNERTLELQGNVENLQKSRSCESGWVEFAGHCYFFSGFELNWSQAEMMCLNRGSHLVIINSQAEQNFLQSKTNRRYHWIGLTDLEKEGTFKWVDGTELSYIFWSSGEPSNKNEHCVHLLYEGTWNNNFCDRNIYAICEKNLICY